MQREQFPARIKLKEMPDNKRYNKLTTESKLFMNIIKMICYRAETAMAELIAPFFSKAKQEKRMLIKQLLNTAIDLIPNEKDQTLTVKLYTLTTPRANRAVKELCVLLNQTESIFPGTKLKLIYEIAAN